MHCHGGFVGFPDTAPFVSLQCNLNPRTRQRMEWNWNGTEWTDGLAYIEIYCLIALITIRQCLPLCVAMSPFLFHSQFRSPLLSPVANAKEFHLNYFLMSCSHTHTHRHKQNLRTHRRASKSCRKTEKWFENAFNWGCPFFFRNSCKEILEWPKGRIVYSEISFDSCLLPTNKFICFHTYSINSDYLDAEACLAKNIYFMPESHSKSAKKPIAIV